MGAIKTALIVGAVLFAALAAVHEYSPAALAPLYNIPGVREWASKIHFYLSFSYWGLGPRPSGGAGSSGGDGDGAPNWAKLMEDQGLSFGDDPPPERIFTAEELAQATRDGPKIYLGILGRVYDVTDGKDHYGPGGGYDFFAGRDATRAFVTGDFSPDGLVDDVDGLSDSDLRGLDEWSKFYDREYSYVGKVVGRFYDGRGRATAEQRRFSQRLKAAFKSRDAEDGRRALFPPCNSEWRQGQGGRVWCSEKSGGIERDWAGVPRKLYEPGTGKFRCACVKNFGPPSSGFGAAAKAALSTDTDTGTGDGDLTNPNLMEYEDCPRDSASCQIEDKDS